MAHTKISWAATELLHIVNDEPTIRVVKGYTFNPWWGCRRVSEACDHCYICPTAKLAGRSSDLLGNDERIFMRPSTWALPDRWNRKAHRMGHRIRVFCASMGDVFETPLNHPMYPDMQIARQKLFDIIARCTALDWMLLTKRPAAIKSLLPQALWGARHVWIGFTAEDQHWFDKRWPLVREWADRGHPIFISVEPQLGPITLPEELALFGPQIMVIVGGESGGQARSFDPARAIDILEQCRRLGTRFHMKQLGARPTTGKLRHPHGSNMREWPAELRIREWAEALPVDQP